MPLQGIGQRFDPVSLHHFKGENMILEAIVTIILVVIFVAAFNDDHKDAVKYHDDKFNDDGGGWD